MVLTVIHILCGMLSLIGQTAVICGVSERMAAVADDERYLFVLLKGEDAGVRLHAAVEEVQSGRCRASGVIAVDAGLTEDMRRVCGKIAAEVGFVALYTTEEFQNWLGGVAGGPNV